MQLKDSRGLAVSTGSPAALEMYELAALQTTGYFGNPLATLDEALAEDEDFAAAHALRADLAVMSSEQGALPLIRGSVTAMERIGSRATAREQAHVAAAAAWLEGRFERAAHLYGVIAILANELIASRMVRLPVQIFSVAMILIVGPGRIYTGAHWPTDVLGAYLYGVLFLIPMLVAYQALKSMGPISIPAPRPATLLRLSSLPVSRRG